MDSDQPYRPPNAEVGGPSAGWSGGGTGNITPGTVEALKKTRPWVLFVAVMILIGCAFMVVVALFVMAASSFIPDDTTPFPGVAMGLIYLVMAALYLYPGIRLLQFAAAIKRIGGTDDAQAIENALKQQLAFWRFVGLVTLAMIGLYLLIIFAAVIAGVAMS